MRVSGILLFIAILSGFCAPVCEATVYHSSGTAASVQSIHNTQAVPGDTITLPAGTFTWTTGVTITKAITLQGAGVGSTIIKDAVQSGQLILWTLAAGQPARLTGIEFQNGGRVNPAPAPGGILRVVGSNTNGSTFRWDHCSWQGPNGFPVFDTVIGVIDHNTFGPTGQYVMVYVYGSFWDNQGIDGDGSWAAATGFGSSQWLFFEDNTWNNNDTIYTKGAIDSENGGRWVLRHNTINACIPSNHGTESGGRGRGCRAMEIYNNTFTSSINGTVGGSRGGSLVVHDNVINGYFGQKNWDLGNYRTFWPFPPWGGADGTNPWDVNDPTIFFTGTAAANSNGGVIVQVSGVNWTPNQWARYTLRRLTDNGNSGTVNFGWIYSNTSNTISYSGGNYGPNMSFVAGDSLEIRKVIHAMDQPGRGRGSLVTGYPPVRPAGWNDQVTEPCYQWNNGALLHFTPGPGINPGDYFDNTPMPGYTPYTYPHPMATGGGTGTGRAVIADFNSDGHPDYVLSNPGTHQTAIWYLNNNAFIAGALGPSITAGWGLDGVADFNRDVHPDYALFNPTTDRTAIWYMSGSTFIRGAYGPTIPGGWALVATADFNGNNYPEYVLYNASTRQTAIWYMNNNLFVSGGYGPTLPVNWSLVGVADFDGNGHRDYVLFNSSNHQTAIWYLSGRALVRGVYGPTIPSGWALVATADFNSDAHPDYLLYNPASRQTAIWYLNNNNYVSAAYGPTLPAGWSLFAQ